MARAVVRVCARVRVCLRMCGCGGLRVCASVATLVRVCAAKCDAGQGAVGACGVT